MTHQQWMSCTTEGYIRANQSSVNSRVPGRKSFQNRTNEVLTLAIKDPDITITTQHYCRIL
jgi:hypothetical protein